MNENPAPISEVSLKEDAPHPRSASLSTEVFTNLPVPEQEIIQAAEAKRIRKRIRRIEGQVSSDV